ncbi:unnamed protein product [Symbiodinium sp. CCMP2592]|nr:unnamed protein product [Symbiodinium sp. CCMP2592]
MADGKEVIEDSLTVRELQTVLDPKLVRGVSMSECLSGWAQHFMPPDPGMFNVDKEKYKLSKQTESFDEFLSHDWATSRWLKFMSLLMIHNSRAAAVTALLSSICVAILQAFEVLPADSWIVFFVYPVYWFVLLFWQRIRSLFFTPATVFLDKLCIAQHDEDLKLQGILGLAGFLDRSHQLTILWSHRYFSRMWCAYELATFLRNPKQQKPIQIMPVKMAVVLFLFAGCEVSVMVGFFWMPEFTLKDGSGHFFEQLFWFWLSLAPFVLLSVPVTFYIGMSLFEDLQELPQQMANFSVQHAQCFCCSNGHRHPQTGEVLPCDRELIFGTLKKWYGEPGDVGTEHLDRFDYQVQESLAPTVLRGMGRSWIPLNYTVYMVGVSSVPGLSRTILSWKAGPPVELAGFDLAVWGLRELLKWAFLALVSIFWVQLSMHVLHYGLRWSKYITRFGCATVLWIPVMLGVFIEYTSFMVCIEYTDHNSVLPVILFVAWCAWIFCLSYYSNGPLRAAQSAKARKSKPVFKEDVPDVQVEVATSATDPLGRTHLSEIALEVGPDDVSNADTISVFET